MTSFADLWVKADFDEEDHPRDATGRFSSGSDGGSDTPTPTAIEGDWSDDQKARLTAAAEGLQAKYNVPLKTIRMDPDREAAGKSSDTIYLPTKWADETWMIQRAKEWDGLIVESSLEGTIRHEYGHILDGALLRLPENADGSRPYDELDAFIHEKIDVPGLGTLERIQSGLESPSAYGSENRYEWVAEGFADWNKNGEDAHPTSQFIGKLFDRYLGKNE